MVKSVEPVGEKTVWGGENSGWERKGKVSGEEVLESSGDEDEGLRLEKGGLEDSEGAVLDDVGLKDSGAALEEVGLNDSGVSHGLNRTDGIRSCWSRTPF